MRLFGRSAVAPANQNPQKNVAFVAVNLSLSLSLFMSLPLHIYIYMVVSDEFGIVRNLVKNDLLTPGAIKMMERAFVLLAGRVNNTAAPSKDC